MFLPAIAFSAPLTLVALAILPLIYYLLRLTPPRPREIPFPPLKLILDAPPKEETPARTPWWVMLLRLALAALVILAMAGPVLNPVAAGGGGPGPLVLLMDDGWPAAGDWSLRQSAAARRLDAAGREGRAVAVLAFSEGPRELAPTDAAKAQERLRALKPQPIVPDREAALAPLRAFLAAHPDAEIVWIADGLTLGAAEPFARKLADMRPFALAAPETSPLALSGARNQPGFLDVSVLRAGADARPEGMVRGLDLKGLVVGAAPFAFKDADIAQARFDLPIELRNDIARLDIVGENSAGAVALLDERWKRRRVGIVSGESSDVAQPLLAPNYYLAKALTPFAEVREAQGADPIRQLIDAKVAALFLADVGVVSGPAHDALARYVEDGGVLVRFAGVRLAGSTDDLIPVRLRRGGRVLGGSLSWDRPKALAPFDRDSPFFGLGVPAEVTVTRQVLAEPEAGLRAKTWAALADGTPLVTAARRGKGLIALVHVSADTAWSNLPISGLFVDMLRRFVAMAAQGAPPQGDKADRPAQTLLAPARTLDGFGAFQEPPPGAKPIPADYAGPATVDHPPGFYGQTDALVALDAVPAGTVLQRADLALPNVTRLPLKAVEPIDLRPWIVALAGALFVADALVALWLSGAGPALARWRPGAAAVLGLLLALHLPAARDARAQTLSTRDMDAALHTRLAYALTGDNKIDETSRAGLATLSGILDARTTLAPGEPVGLDPARDELAFYPLIYWPVVADSPQPSAQAVARLTSYMKQGGTVLFDTRDALSARPDGPPTPEARWLRQMLSGVDVPELERIPPDHVATKTFYLLQNFVGRYTIGETWIEALPPPDASDASARPARAGDSVSPIIISSNDLASAWAADSNGEPLYPLVPGGTRQRELALRGGVNLVMYTLTGNYKADQVHVRDLLERLAH